MKINEIIGMKENNSVLPTSIEDEDDEEIETTDASVGETNGPDWEYWSGGISM